MIAGHARAVIPIALFVATLGLSALTARAIRGRSKAEARPHVAVAPSEPRAAPAPNRGKLLYQVQCARCHGPEGRGDGPDSAELRPPPRDFVSWRWRGGAGPEAIRKAIVEGIPGTAMYATGGNFSPRERDALVDHVRSLAASGLEAKLRSAGFEPASAPASGFEVEDFRGQVQRLEFGPSGPVKLVVFWGTSCAPCLDELPKLQGLAESFADRGLEVIPVCVDEADRDRVARTIRGKFDRSPSFLSTDPMARVRYDLQALPVAALIDRQGQLVGIARGAVDWEGERAKSVVEGLVAGDR